LHRIHLTIRLRLILASSLLLLVIFTGMTVYLVRINTETLRTNLQNEAKAFAALATAPVADSYNLYSESGTDQIRAAMANYLGLSRSITNITVVDLNGHRLFAYHPATSPTVTAKQASHFTPLYVKQGGRLQYVVYPYFSTSGAHPFTMVYSVSNDQVDSAIRHEVESLVLFGILLLLLTSGLTNFLLDRIIVRPVREVSRQAKVISDGHLEQQISVHGQDEIALLGQAVNSMAESLKHSIAQLEEIDKVKSEFMAITSHNLRTPLTIINGYLESVEMFDTVDKLKEMIGRIGDSVKRLGSFSEDVLIISSIELGEKMPRKQVSANTFMQTIIDQTRTAAELQGLSLVATIETQAMVSVNEPYLRNAVWNLVDNALKFTPKGGKITITTTESDGMVHIQVADTGIGIAADELSKLFTKFHRATSVIRYDYQGTGIGLYATKIIIEQQGGNIEVKSEEGHGSTFTINLPVASAAETAHTSP